MIKRSKRLAMYLEGKLGWDVFPSDTWCPKCKRDKFGHFCSECGTKLTSNSKDQTYKDLEEAITFALNNEKPDW